MKKLIILICALAFLSSCDDKEKTPDDFPLPSKAEGVVFIANEGNYQFGNATLSVIDQNTGSVSDNVFESVNKRKLGDVLQSVTVHKDLAYLVINNSQKIEILNPVNYTSAGTINGFTSPRYMVAKNEKGYVSEYYANAVRVIDLISKKITKTITIPGWSEEMEWVGDELFVCNANRDKIYIINTLTDELKDSIAVGMEPVSISSDAVGKLWVLCKGNKSKTTNPSLHKIDIPTKVVELNLKAGNYEDGASKLRMSADKKQLLWISGSVFSMSVFDNQVPIVPFLLNNGKAFYGLGVDPYKNEVYVSDAIDYVQKSTVLRFAINGAPKGQFKAGINTGNFAFYKP